MRRPHALHAPALLIDQDRRIRPADSRAEISRQPPHLFGRLDVALEEDQPPRFSAAEKCALAFGERCSRTP